MNDENTNLFEQALCCLQIDDPQEKAQHFSRLEKLAPSSYFIEFYLGQNLYNAGKPDEALPQLSQALDLDPDQRPGFLDDECGGDQDLRHEVEALLARQGEGNALFETASLQRQQALD